MPRTTRRHERREQIAEVAWRVIERDGIAKVTLGEIAREGGYTTGVLALLPQQAELLAYALGLVVDRRAERVVRVAQVGLRASLAELLPLDAERRRECVIWLALTTASLQQPDRTAIVSSSTEDIDDLADELQALIDGSLSTRSATLELFALRGFESVTLADVAASADVGERTLYRYFADKEELLFGQQAEVEHHLQAALAERSAHEQPAIALPEAMVSLSPFWQERQAEGRARQAVIDASPALKARERAKHTAYERMLTAGLTGRGVDDLQARLLARTAVGCLDEAIARWFADDDPNDPGCKPAAGRPSPNWPGCSVRFGPFE